MVPIRWILIVAACIGWIWCGAELILAEGPVPRSAFGAHLYGLLGAALLWSGMRHSIKAATAIERAERNLDAARAALANVRNLADARLRQWSTFEAATWPAIADEKKDAG